MIHIAPNFSVKLCVTWGAPWWFARTTAQNATASAGKPKKVDDDPDGEKLLPGTPRGPQGVSCHVNDGTPVGESKF